MRAGLLLIVSLSASGNSLDRGPVTVRLRQMDYSLLVGQTPVSVTFRNNTAKPIEVRICKFELVAVGFIGHRSLLATRGADDACGGDRERLAFKIEAESAAEPAPVAPVGATTVELALDYFIVGEKERRYAAACVEIPPADGSSRSPAASRCPAGS